MKRRDRAERFELGTVLLEQLLDRHGMTKDDSLHRSRAELSATGRFERHRHSNRNSCSDDHNKDRAMKEGHSRLAGLTMCSTPSKLVDP